MYYDDDEINPCGRIYCKGCGRCDEDYDYHYTSSYGGTTLASYDDEIKVKMDSETYYKLQSICTLKDKTEEEFVREIIEEKIINIDVVKYVEELSKINSKESRKYSYSDETVYIEKKDLDTEAVKRLTIFAGAYKKPEDSYDYDPFRDISSDLFNEKIKEFDLLELVKEENKN